MAACACVLGLYMTTAYLEVSAAALLQLLVDLLWPPAHLGLRAGEALLLSLAGWFGAADQVGQAAYCDMAASWCQRFRLMCDSQCSFTSIALDRSRSAQR